MNKEKKIYKTITMRVDNSLYEELKIKALKEDVTLNNYLINIVRKEAFKDINIHVQELGTLEHIRSEIGKLQNEYKLFTSIFNHYLKWYFALNDFECEHIGEKGKQLLDKNNINYDTLRKELINQTFLNADKNRKRFFKTFKSENRNNILMQELLFADMEETGE